MGTKANIGLGHEHTYFDDEDGQTVILAVSITTKDEEIAELLLRAAPKLSESLRDVMNSHLSATFNTPRATQSEGK